MVVYALVVGGLAILNYTKNPENLWVLLVGGALELPLMPQGFRFRKAESRWSSERPIAWSVGMLTDTAQTLQSK